MNDDDRSARLLESAAAVLSGAPQMRLGRVLLNKALFYLDLWSLLECGSTATGNTYVALREGPVISGYDKKLIRRLVRHGMAAEEPSDGFEKPLALLQEPAYQHLNARLRAKAAEIGRRFASMRAKDLSDYSHENAGWQLAWSTGQSRGGAARVINMDMALQQIVETDTWLREEPDHELAAAFEVAESGGPVQPWV